MNNYGFQEIDEQTKDKFHEMVNSYAKIYIPDENFAFAKSIAKMVDMSGLKIQTANMLSKIAAQTISNLCSEMQVYHKVAEEAAIALGEITKKIVQSIPKIKFPNIDEDTRNRFRFMKIVSQVNYPIYFEIDTELQKKIINIYDSYVGESEEDMLNEIEKCILDYYNHDMLEQILYSWIQQPWIHPERKAALKEAIEEYEEGKYYATGSILMCQLGGLITELYDTTDAKNLLSTEDKKEVLSLYHIKSQDSEKSKVVQMMSIQSGGAYLWYSSSKYFMDYTYSSSEDTAVFEKNPGRNKICHGEQTNYGRKEMALKAILVTDIVAQLGIQMMNEIEQAS